MTTQPVLIAGKWRDADASGTFQAVNPKTKQKLDGDYPVSKWSDLDEALTAASEAFVTLRGLPAEKIAGFLESYADKIEANAESLAKIAEQESGMPASPRFVGGEITRTFSQLRAAAKAAREGSWANPTVDTGSGLRSMLEPLGVVSVFGPNNFPFAFNGVAGGDFAAAIAARNPVIAKGHPSHPKTTQKLAELCFEAVKESGLPDATVQMVYRMDKADGTKMVSDPRNAALGYTGSRHAGLAMKKACEEAGKLAYLEMSSINPVVMLPGALAERGEDLVGDFVGSCLLGVGQFCTNPGLILTIKGDDTEAFISGVTKKFAEAPVGTLLNEAGEKSLSEGIEAIKSAGATLLTGGQTGAGEGFSVANTLLRISGSDYLKNPEALQTEAFGNSSLVVVADDIEQLHAITRTLEGNLTGCIYSCTEGSDDKAYSVIEAELRQHVGRMLNDKMPTGVAVVAAQNHGGPYPATGHPVFSAVGFPGSIRRFSKLTCYDNVRHDRLPELLKDENPLGAWRWIDGEYTQESVPTPVATTA